MKFIRAFDAPHSPTSRIGDAERAILQTLEMDWRTITAQDDSKGRFDPALMDAALPYAFMLERTAPDALRTRVAGQKLHEMMRMDPRGMSFTAFFTGASRDIALRLAETAFTTPAIVGIPLTAQRGLGRKPLRGEALLLPLRDAEGHLNRVMGALVVSGEPGSRGLRFDVADDQPIRCDTLLDGQTERRAKRGVPLPSGKPPAPRVNMPKRGALRLVVDNT